MIINETIINTAFFYIISIISLIASLFCLFQKNTINAIISALIVFWGISGLYFLLNAPYLACIQIIIWGVGIGILMLFSVMMTDEKCNKKEAFNLKTLLTPLIATVFAVITIPFLIYQFKGLNTTQTFTMTAFSETLYKNNPFGFEMVGILLFLVIVGISAVITLKTAKKGGFKDE